MSRHSIEKLMKRYFAIVVLLFLAVPAIGQQRLLVIGGGERPPVAMKKFVEWSGGAKSRIACSV